MLLTLPAELPEKTIIIRTALHRDRKHETLLSYISSVLLISVRAARF